MLALGAPKEFVEILEFFDVNQVRYIECELQVEGSPILPLRSLMQGCPASPLRLTVITAAWVYYMKKKAPTARLSVHMDDRILFQEGRSVDTMTSTMNENAKLERIFD